MNVNYNKLWKLIIDSNLKKTEFAKVCGIGQNTFAELRKNEYVSMEMLLKICYFFNCGIGDIVDVSKNRGQIGAE